MRLRRHVRAVSPLRGGVTAATPGQELSIYGQEKTGDTIRLANMNLAVHGLSGDIREGNTYYEDLHDSVGKFDFVMANPPFNVNKIDKTKLEDDPRFPFGLPKPDNGNYLWIQTFYSALNGSGRAGFVMANSASDARGSELEIRRKMIEDRSVDVIIAVGTNMFYTVTLPRHPVVPRPRQEAHRPRPTRCSSSTPARSTTRSTEPTGTGHQSKSSSSPTSSASGEARSPSSLQAARRCSAPYFPTETYGDVAGICGCRHT